MPHSAESDPGLHCLPISLSGVSRLQWVKVNFSIIQKHQQQYFYSIVLTIIFLQIISGQQLCKYFDKHVKIFDKHVSF